MNNEWRKELIQTWIPLIKLWFFLITVILLVYTLPVTILSHIFFNHQARGSLVIRDHRVLGSTLYGQQFSKSSYFWGRPSMTFYQSDILSPSSIHWIGDLYWKNFGMQQEYFWKQHGIRNPSQELLFPSSSQVDPHLSLEAMRLQIPRVALARHISEKKLEFIIDQYTEKPFMGVFGQTCVNVLKVNLELDRDSSSHT